MAEIDTGALSFKSIMDNSQLNGAIAETLRRIQGLSDGTAAGGKTMETAFQKSADLIKSKITEIDAAADVHINEIRRLEAEYKQLGIAAGGAFSREVGGSGYLTERQQEIRGEITMRKALVKELQDGATKFEEYAKKQEETRRKTEENANVQQSMRGRIRALKEEMMLLIDQGIDEQSDAYKRLEAELGRLTDIQSDVAQQGRVLANDEAQFQGIITGLSGLAGGFSAVTGAVSLFAGENDDLQKVMAKVQSVMAITIGMQQVAQTLNKDSAFQQVTINGLKKWWRNIVVQATAAETAETVATTANTAAKTANTAANTANTASETVNTAATGAQSAAATAGTAANLTLAGAFRAVGLAIKSIPVFGWIVAGISALAGIFLIFRSRAQEAKKAQEEFAKSVAENAYKPIGAIENLAFKWNQLGNDLEAKKRFVEENKKAFEELGMAIDNVAEAESVLSDPKKIQAFIDAQIAKAKAMIYTEQATEKIKESMSTEPERYRKATGNDIRAGYYTYTNEDTGQQFERSMTETEEWKKWNEKQKILKAEIQQCYEDATLAESEAVKKMEETGMKAINTYAEGTIGALEQAISQKQEELKKLLPDTETFKNTKTEIENLQKQLDSITGRKDKKEVKSDKDPFTAMLEERKKKYGEYLKWINSGDESIRRAAPDEFADILKDGDSYLAYLEKLKQDTAKTKDEIRQINNEIVGETGKTMMDAFKETLDAQLSNAGTVIDRLNLIEQKREELKKSDDNDPLKAQKTEILDNSEKDLEAKRKQETRQILEEYSSYLDKKIKLDQEYNNDLVLLEKRRSEATTDADRTKIDQAIANRTKQYEKDSKGSGDADYDALLAEYRSYQQKRQAMSANFDKKIALSAEKENAELVKQLEAAKAKALSELDMEELTGSDTWNQLFGNLDNLTVSEMIKLRDKIESEWEKLNLSPEQLDVLRNKIDEVTSQVEQRTPFIALREALKQYREDAGKANFKDVMKGVAASLDLVKGSFDAVVGGLETMGVEMDESTQKVIKDIGDIIDGAGQLATGIATGNPLAIVQGSISVISNGIDLIAGAKDRKLNKSIEKHLEDVSKLENAYKGLERAVDKALGGDVYIAQKAAIENMRQQQRELYAAAEAERSKKKGDEGKAAEYENRAKELGYAIEDAMGDMVNNIISTDAKSIADQLGDAFIEAFAKGEDAAEAWGDSVNDIVAQVVRNMLIQELLQKPIGQILDKYSAKWVDADGNFMGFDVVKNSLGSLGSELTSLSTGFADAFKDMPEDLKNTILGKTESDAADTSLTGEVKGVTEESASMIGGQLNAMRMNQLESTAVLRQQLFHLANIENNTSHLLDIRNDIRDIKNGSGGNSLRSQGLS